MFYTVNDYLNEVFDYGGIPTKRIDIIKDLREQGLTSKEIDMYMFGLEKKEEV